MKKVLAAAAAAILCFSLSACGTSKQEGNGNGVTYTYKDQTITMKAPPKRIIELSAPLLNMAYAVGGTSAARPETTSPIPEEANPGSRTEHQHGNPGRYETGPGAR